MMFYENPFSSINDFNSFQEIVKPSVLRKFFDAMPTVSVPVNQQTSCLNNSDAKRVDARFIFPLTRVSTTIHEEIFKNTLSSSPKASCQEIKEKSYFANYCRLLAEKEDLLTKV